MAYIYRMSNRTCIRFADYVKVSLFLSKMFYTSIHYQKKIRRHSVIEISLDPNHIITLAITRSDNLRHIFLWELLNEWLCQIHYKYIMCLRTAFAFCDTMLLEHLQSLIEQRHIHATIYSIVILITVSCKHFKCRYFLPCTKYNISSNTTNWGWYKDMIFMYFKQNYPTLEWCLNDTLL